MTESHESQDRVNALDELYVSPDDLPFQGKADLNYLVNAWRKLDIKQAQNGDAMFTKVKSAFE